MWTANTPCVCLMQLCFKIHGNYKCAATSEKTLVYMKKHFWYVCVCVCVRLYVGGRVCACVCVYADNGLLWQQQNKETQIMSLWLLLSAPLFAFPSHNRLTPSVSSFLPSLHPFSHSCFSCRPLSLSDSATYRLSSVHFNMNESRAAFPSGKTHTHTHRVTHTS